MATEKQLIRYRIDDDTEIIIEGQAEPGDDGPQRISRGSRAEAEASERFDSAISRLRPAAEKVLDAFRELNTPSEIQLEFGVKFGAKAGAIIASADSEATFKVSLKWQNPKAQRGDG